MFSRTKERVVESWRSIDPLSKKVFIGFITPPTLSILLHNLPKTEEPFIETARGVVDLITASEIGWIGGGLIIEGTNIAIKALSASRSLVKATT